MRHRLRHPPIPHPIPPPTPPPDLYLGVMSRGRVYGMSRGIRHHKAQSPSTFHTRVAKGEIRQPPPHPPRRAASKEPGPARGSKATQEPPGSGWGVTVSRSRGERWGMSGSGISFQRVGWNCDNPDRARLRDISFRPLRVHIYSYLRHSAGTPRMGGICPPSFSPQRVEGGCPPSPSLPSPISDYSYIRDAPPGHPIPPPTPHPPPGLTEPAHHQHAPNSQTIHSPAGGHGARVFPSATHTPSSG